MGTAYEGIACGNVSERRLLQGWAGLGWAVAKATRAEDLEEVRYLE